MAIPFYENEEGNQQQHNAAEVDQVDGPLLNSQNMTADTQFLGQETQHSNLSENDLQAWKILALAMCKALKDFYQQNMSQSSSQLTSTAIIQILPNGEVKPKWN